MRKRITYANVAATLALVFSMSGGALAASHYLVNSTKQINPKVLKRLKGATGPPGLTGATGPAGATGKEGKEGKEGSSYTVQSTLKSGQTETGVYEAWGTAPNSGAAYFGGVVDYRVPLAAPLDEEHVVFNPGGGSSTHCSGIGHAEAGYLCVYESASGSGNRTFGNINQPDTTDGEAGSSTTGFGIYFDTTGTNQGAWSYGGWAVTAP